MILSLALPLIIELLDHELHYARAHRDRVIIFIIR